MKKWFLRMFWGEAIYSKGIEIEDRKRNTQQLNQQAQQYLEQFTKLDDSSLSVKKPLLYLNPVTGMLEFSSEYFRKLGQKSS